jgi:hypothetical protein
MANEGKTKAEAGDLRPEWRGETGDLKAETWERLETS